MFNRIYPKYEAYSILDEILIYKHHRFTVKRGDDLYNVVLYNDIEGWEGLFFCNNKRDVYIGKISFDTQGTIHLSKLPKTLIRITTRLIINEYGGILVRNRMLGRYLKAIMDISNEFPLFKEHLNIDDFKICLNIVPYHSWDNFEFNYDDNIFSIYLKFWMTVGFNLRSDKIKDETTKFINKSINYCRCVKFNLETREKSVHNGPNDNKFIDKDILDELNKFSDNMTDGLLRLKRIRSFRSTRCICEDCKITSKDKIDNIDNIDNILLVDSCMKEYRRSDFHSFTEDGFEKYPYSYSYVSMSYIKIDFKFSEIKDYFDLKIVLTDLLKEMRNLNQL